MLNILFMGTPDIAKDALEEVYKNKYNIIGVVTAVDKPKGRGMNLCPTPVKEYALEKNLKIYQPEKVKGNEEFIKEIKQLNPDIICIVAYGKIIPAEIINIPKYGAINVHYSLLPKYRGSAPIQWPVINGDATTGVTSIYINDVVDGGDIILQKETTIGENETTGELWERISKLGAELLIETLKQIESNSVVRKKQNEEEATLAPMLYKEMGNIDWSAKTASQIKNLVRGLNPIMGAYTYLNGKKLKIWKAQVIENEDLGNNISLETKVEGEVVYVDSKKGIYVKTLDKILLIQEIQAENSKKMDAPDFLRGNKIEIGEIFKNTL
ncbi:MAG: methionyl-tRNA formyltransferase [Lachnospiraceae bacterium]|jgi:methionyl-tRNA formyltransferase|nr:methionyl-tRNA formyltransferase [Lachnospiraceae bacterium]